MFKNKKIKTKKERIANIILSWIILTMFITGGVITIRDRVPIKDLYSPRNYIKTIARLPEIKNKLVGTFGTIRTITAYNAGVIAQCDNSPCISASGDDICQLLEQGVKVCACNFVPFRTELEIENYGRCIVLDRVNSKYNERVDIAMKSNEIKRAKEFGSQKLKVFIYK